MASTHAEDSPVSHQVLTPSDHEDEHEDADQADDTYKEDIAVRTRRKRGTQVRRCPFSISFPGHGHSGVRRHASKSKPPLPELLSSERKQRFGFIVSLTREAAARPTVHLQLPTSPHLCDPRVNHCSIVNRGVRRDVWRRRHDEYTCCHICQLGRRSAIMKDDRPLQAPISRPSCCTARSFRLQEFRTMRLDYGLTRPCLPHSNSGYTGQRTASFTSGHSKHQPVHHYASQRLMWSMEFSCCAKTRRPRLGASIRRHVPQAMLPSFPVSGLDLCLPCLSFRTACTLRTTTVLRSLPPVPLCLTTMRSRMYSIPCAVALQCPSSCCRALSPYNRRPLSEFATTNVLSANRRRS